MKHMSGLGLLFVLLIPLSTPAAGVGENSLVKFKGGIGAIPVSDVVVSTTTPPVTTAPATWSGVSPQPDRFGSSRASMRM